MNPINYSTIDPGIRQTVKFLRDVCGLNTTDSGDGVSKGEDGLSFPHVFAVVEDPEQVVKTCKRVAIALWEQGVRPVSTPPDMSELEPGTAVIECNYNVADGVAIVQVLGLSDDGLRLARAGRVRA